MVVIICSLDEDKDKHGSYYRLDKGKDNHGSYYIVLITIKTTIVVFIVLMKIKTNMVAIIGLISIRTTMVVIIVLTVPFLYSKDNHCLFEIAWNGMKLQYGSQFYTQKSIFCS